MAQNNHRQTPQERFLERLTRLIEVDPQIKAMVPDKLIQQATLQPGLSNEAILDLIFTGYAERPALGERVYLVKPDEVGRQVRELVPEYKTINYGELRAKIIALASAWQHHEQHRVHAGEFVCILGTTGIDFAVIDLATVYTQAITVPLQTTLSNDSLEGIFRDTAPVSVYAAITDLAEVIQLVVDNGAIHSVVVFEYDSRVDAEREIFESAQASIERAGATINMTTIDQLVECGKGQAWQSLPPHKDGLERMAGLIHSSGSTGTPKGVIISERGMNFAWLGTGVDQSPTITTVFAPMNHFLGRHQVYVTLSTGGTAYYTARPDMTTLFDDIRLVRPTFCFFFPRVLDLIYQHYQNECLRGVAAGGDEVVVDAQVRAKMHANFLGGRLLAGTFGSAPTPIEVEEFMRDCFEILLIEGYGSTESGIMTTQMDRVMRPPVIDYKLRDVPELGYYTTDKPYPRGELLVKSVNQSSGFFKRPEETVALFDEDGYVVTGDIMEERDPDHIVYIDRRNDVLKLSQAEFVAVGPLGATFEGGSSMIHQAYIYGNSSQSFLLAVIVPDMEAVITKIGVDPSDSDMKALIRAEMQEVSRIAELRTFELPRDFIIEMEPFSLENGLLSSVRKRMRPNLKRKYGEQLESLYEQIEVKRQEELKALKDPNSSLTVLEKIIKVLEATLGIEGIDPETDLNFSDMGGDSLGSVSFSMLLEDIFGVPLSVNAIVSPAGNPRHWANAIESALNNEGLKIETFESIHGKGATTLYAKDLDINNFLDQETLDTIPVEPPSAETRIVLMTGANGFLGRFLCLQWMERVAPLGGKVICLIRANSDEMARNRLDKVFIGVDPELEQHYRMLSAKHLEVIAADIGEHNFGLSQDIWSRLAEEIDHIVHPAALVNHVLSYEHLFGPNVFGTAELIRLALTKRQKRIDFISSLAAALRVELNTDGSDCISDEDSPLLDTVELGEGYADSYGASKWASEVQLQSTYQHYGLPINIFRGNMMLAHSTYKGQINVPDMMTRLFYSVIMTGLAPASFYEIGVDGKRAHAHYDGLPSDIIASTVVGLGAQIHNEIRTYNIINHHIDDGISLDSMMDWIESAGYEVEREPDHAVWLTRFKEKLNVLTEAQRKFSSVDILHQFAQLDPAIPLVFGCQNFKDGVRELSISSEAINSKMMDSKIPHLTEAFIHKYLKDMHLLDLIPEPKANNKSR